MTAVGGQHTEIYEGLPGCASVGLIVEGGYHPDDSVFVPEQRVTTLLVPAGRICQDLWLRREALCSVWR